MPILACPVLVITITSMVFVSIQPFAFRKIFVLVAALLCLSSALCFGDSLFMSLHSMPHDARLNRARPVPIPLSIQETAVQPLVLLTRQS
jgi:hypothetical protein